MRNLFTRRSDAPNRPASPVDRATPRDIALAYKLILKRAPDADGLRHFTERIEDGLALQDLISTLMRSQEYQERVAEKATRAVDHASSSEPGGTADRAAPDGLIAPRDVLQRWSLAELNEASDEYYRRVIDPTPLMIKPLAFLHETPEMLQNLGYLLGGLALGKTMTVLDFGAGTCWLSRILAQLQCRPICCDVSPAALAIGQRLFKEQPPIAAAFEPTFLSFDGRRIDLPDASVDRIVCFDAFHHVPNPDAVIPEFARVLKPGGIAGFSEPGRLHSHSPQSQYEMRNHRVLENDVKLDELFAIASRVGFTSLSVQVLNDCQISLADYQALFERNGDADDVNARISGEMYRTMQNRAVFFLQKGPLKRDSRSHLGLEHLIRAHQVEATASAEAPAQLTFTLTNTGEARWLHRNVANVGMVRLASHLYTADGDLLDVDFSRHDLAADVEPGESVDVAITLRMPRSGSFRLTFDLVSEGVTWFENVGSKPVDVEIRASN